MIATAIHKNVSISASKANLCCKLIRNKPVSIALRILQNQPQKSAKYLFKLLSSASANAVNNHAMSSEDLYVFESFANQGPTLKRTFFRARGRADLMKKRSSHLVIKISDDKDERKKLNKCFLKPRAHQYKYKHLIEKEKTSVEIKPKIFVKKEYERQKRDGTKG